MTTLRKRQHDYENLRSTVSIVRSCCSVGAILAATNADWFYFRYLPPKGQLEAVRSERKRAFIAGATVSGNVPENWQHAVDVGINVILTDYPFELAAMLRKTQ